MNKPFIQLFQTPNSFYFLDVNTCRIVEVSKEAYDYLCKLLFDCNIDGCSKPQELIDLESQGFLTVESAVKEIRHTYSDYLDTFLDRKLSKITLQLTQKCNFRCTYCIYSEDKNVLQRTHSNKSMTFETAKKAVYFLWEHSVDSRKVNVGFYGGEPLLEFPLLKEVVEYSLARFKGKEVTFTITTNGTLLTEEIIYYFYERNIDLMISLDGPKEINDRYRVFADGTGTFDAVYRKIEMIREISPEYADKLRISMVIDPSNDFDCINSFELDCTEINRMNLMPSIVEHRYDNASTEFEEEYSWKYEYQFFLAVLSHYDRINRDFVSPIALNTMTKAIDDAEKTKITAKLFPVDTPSGPCIPGQLRLFIDVDGRFFPCERVSEKSPSMCIGSLDGGFNIDNAKNLLNIGNLSGANCIGCWCFRFCSLCAKMADDGTETLSGKKKIKSCPQAQFSAFERIRQYLLFREIPLFYYEQIHKDAIPGTGSDNICLVYLPVSFMRL